MHRLPCVQLVLLVALLTCSISPSAAEGPGGGYWVLKGGMPRLQPEPGHPFFGESWNDQNGWVGKIFSRSSNHVEFGYRHPGVQPQFDNTYWWWDTPPNVLVPGELVPVRAGRRQSGPRGGPSIDLGHLKILRLPDGPGTFEARNTEDKAPNGSAGATLSLAVHLHLSGLYGSLTYLYDYEWRSGPPPAGPKDPYAGITPGKPRGAKDGDAVSPPGSGADESSGSPAAVVGTWDWFANGPVTFHPDGTLTQGSLTGRWTMQGSRIKVQWSHGYYDTMILSPDGGELKGYGSRDPNAADGFPVWGKRKGGGGPKAQTPQGPAAPSAITGKWKLDGNGYPGTLEFAMEGGQLTARLFYDVAGRWEILSNVKYVPETGAVSFTRPWSGNPTFQQYQGQMADRTIQGSFTDSHSPGQKFPWNAIKQ